MEVNQTGDVERASVEGGALGQRAETGRKQREATVTTTAKEHQDLALGWEPLINESSR